MLPEYCNQFSYWYLMIPSTVYALTPPDWALSDLKVEGLLSTAFGFHFLALTSVVLIVIWEKIKKLRGIFIVVSEPLIFLAYVIRVLH